ncbi:MAG: hypothetical protein NY202_02680 [Mollicutes bacterium UO1]
MPFFSTPLAAVMVGQEEKEFICNLGNEQLDNSPLELIVCATEEKVVMIEARTQEMKEAELEQAISFAHQEIQILIGFFQHLANSLEPKKEKLEKKKEEISDDNWLEVQGNFRLGEILLTTNLS